MKTQTDLLAAHLKRVGSISGMEAAGMYKVRSLTRRIRDLKDFYNMEIYSQWKRDNTGQRYVRYALVGHLAEQYARSI